MLQFVMGDCSEEVREYVVCTFETNSSHDVQKLIEELGRFYLFFIHLGSELLNQYLRVLNLEISSLLRMVLSFDSKS